MGIIGIYIGKIYEEAKQRPLYLIRETLGFEGSPTAPPRPAFPERFSQS